MTTLEGKGGLKRIGTWFPPLSRQVPTQGQTGLRRWLMQAPVALGRRSVDTPEVLGTVTGETSETESQGEEHMGFSKRVD